MRTVCILGMGKVAREMHVPAWRTLEEQGRAKVVGVFDLAASSLPIARRAFPRARVQEGGVAEALADVDADIYDVCIPGDLHAEVALGLLSSSRHVLIEKPLCRTVAELEQLRKKADQQGRLLSVFQTMRFYPPVEHLRRALDENRVGRVSRIQIVHHARHGLAEAPWVTATPFGLIYENVIHFVDLFHHVLALEDAADIEAARFWALPHRDVILGTEVLARARGIAVYLDVLQDSLAHSAIFSRTYVSGSAADAEMRFYPSGFRLRAGVQDPVHDLRFDLARTFTLSRRLFRRKDRWQPHLRVMNDFLSALDEGRSPMISVESVRPTVAFLQDLVSRWDRSEALSTHVDGRSLR